MAASYGSPYSSYVSAYMPSQTSYQYQTTSQPQSQQTVGAGASVITVQNTAGLQAALSMAVAGETIQLTAGTYSGVSIGGYNYGGAGVTITSADASHHAVITSLSVNGSSGLHFTNLEFSFPKAASDAGTGAYGVQVNGSQNISFDHDSFHGVLDHDPTLDIRGLLLAQDSNISVTNSEFQQLNVGIHDLNVNQLTISGDNVHDIRADGIESSGTSHLIITDNSFSNFWPVGTPITGGDHADAVQFFTQPGQAPNTDISVTNNVMVQGEGKNFQDVFVQDMTAGSSPYKNVTISGNLIVGGSVNAIFVGGPPSGTSSPAAYGVTISNNTIVQLANSTLTPTLHVQDVSGATLSSNTAPKYYLVNDNTRLTESNDSLSSSVSDNGANILTTWLAQHSHPMTVGYTTAGQLVYDTLNPPVITSTPTYGSYYGMGSVGSSIPGMESYASLASFYGFTYY